MVTLFKALQVLYPAANPRTDWIVQNDGNGPFIAYWNPALGTQPSQATIDAVTQEDYDALIASRQAAAEPDLVDMRNQAQAAFDGNATYLAIANPTNAQVAAQVRALTQQNQRIIKGLARLIVRAL